MCTSRNASTHTHIHIILFWLITVLFFMYSKNVHARNLSTWNFPNLTFLDRVDAQHLQSVSSNTLRRCWWLPTGMAVQLCCQGYWFYTPFKEEHQVKATAIIAKGNLLSKPRVGAFIFFGVVETPTNLLYTAHHVLGELATSQTKIAPYILKGPTQHHHHHRHHRHHHHHNHHHHRHHHHRNDHRNDHRHHLLFHHQ